MLFYWELPVQHHSKISVLVLLTIIFFSKSIWAIEITKQQWGNVNKSPVWLYTLENKNGMKVKVTNWGAYTVSIITEDKNGDFADVVLGYDTFEQYYNDCCYNGATVGRYANRISKGQFSIDEQHFQLTTNNGGPEKINHNHGGLVGFHQRIWQSQIVNNSIEMTYLSPDGEQGYPGNLTAKVIYKLNDKNELSLTFEAVTDQATPVNLISHVYYNLSAKNHNIESHVLKINADEITEVGEYLIPTGKFLDVQGTPFDFQQAKPIGRDIRQHHPQLKLAGGVDSIFGGFDHNWVLKANTLNEPDAELHDPASGRLMLVYSSQPGIHLYTGNFMNGSVTGKLGNRLNFRSGLALETQHFPDSPNHKHFPTAILKADQVYQEITIYKFSVI